ncbi:MAG: carboxymuconolactone decarboxylase family protein [Candidatus Dormibacteraeota bacterium]|nr:carboxymuconolactone decarboxylase family protein [Candidatus Dormibacteraeota bacterium]
MPREGDGSELNIFRTLRQHEALSKAFLRFGAYFLRDGMLPPREREIVILRTGWRAGSEYEFGQHTLLGIAAGLTDAEIARLADSAPGTWSVGDQALVDMVDQLCDQDAVSEETWRALSDRWSEPEMLELLLLSGFYRLVSGFLNSVEVALEPATPGWPSGSSPRRHAPREAAP